MTKQPLDSAQPVLDLDQALPSQTHEVFNQPTALSDYNAYSAHSVLQHYVACFDGSWGESQLTDYGALCGGELLHAGFAANHYRPEFISHDRFGHRIDQVNYHPAYHELMRQAIKAGHHNLPWLKPQAGAHVVRAAIEYLHTMADPGSGCPLTMTFAAVPALQQQSELAEQWLPRILSEQYDPSNQPYFNKRGVTIGMAMTEKQGGSDVRANTTVATAINSAAPEQGYALNGHKWFCSAPMCDAFLVLAQTDAGLSCFLMPRWRPDGKKNGFFIQRIKDKVGNVSNASSEVEFRNAFAWRIGALGKGVRTILEMVALTRFDCMVGSSALMGLATQQAIHHTSGRKAFGQPLHQQPLMQNVLADLALEAEAGLSLAMRLAHALDQGQNEHEQSLFRIGTAIGKYWICKRAPQLIAEAMECIGGVAVVKDNVLARLYTEAPVNAIWEGSGNIQCLDVARAFERDQQSREAFCSELERAYGQYPSYDQWCSQLIQDIRQGTPAQGQLRRFVERMAIAWQAATLIQFAPANVAVAFVQNRIEQPHAMFGTLNEASDWSRLITRFQAQL
ncbi:MAG: acyl-CoA dehydrogenase family protein [Gammaproteobacteria bacterium]|nr:acyl-CoA dehydrogenase family protein [Gammaproteobacteria bacterium]